MLQDQYLCNQHIVSWETTQIKNLASARLCYCQAETPMWSPEYTDHADCDTYHSLVLSSMNIQPNPYHRQARQSAKIDIHKTALPQLKEDYCSILEEKLKRIPPAEDPDTLWTNMKTVIYDAALQTFGKRQKRNPDWHISLDVIQPILEKRNAKHSFASSRDQQDKH